VFSPLAQGLLRGKYNDGPPPGSRGATTNWLEGDVNEANLARARQLTALAGELGITPAQLTLAWILRRPEISCVITGATRPGHVLGNVRAAEVKLEEGALARVEAILDNAPRSQP
jgi:aryl-alcohol dehydrogenase-like predicted oxidoreductase